MLTVLSLLGKRNTLINCNSRILLTAGINKRLLAKDRGQVGDPTKINRTPL